MGQRDQKKREPFSALGGQLLKKSEALITVTLKIELNCPCQGCQDLIRRSLKDEQGVRKVHMDKETGRVEVQGEGLQADRILRKVKKVKSRAELVQQQQQQQPPPCELQQQLAAKTDASPPPPPPASSSPPPSPPRKSPLDLDQLAPLLDCERSFALDPLSTLRTRVTTTPLGCTIRLEETRLFVDKFSPSPAFPLAAAAQLPAPVRPDDCLDLRY